MFEKSFQLKANRDDLDQNPGIEFRPDRIDTTRKRIDHSSATLAVLAGGRGDRMGLPKSHLRVERKPILEWLLERMNWPGPTMLVTAPLVIHPPGSELFDCEAVDPIEGMGPLRGVLTALSHLSTPLMVVATVDMPCVNRDILTWLIEALAGHPGYKGVFCRARSRGIRHIEPFPSAFRAAAALPIKERLDNGRRSVRGLRTHNAFLALEAPPEWPAGAWTNLNTQSELRAFEARLRRSQRQKGEE